VSGPGIKCETVSPKDEAGAGVFVRPLNGNANGSTRRKNSHAVPRRIEKKKRTLGLKRGKEKGKGKTAETIRLLSRPEHASLSRWGGKKEQIWTVIGHGPDIVGREKGDSELSSVNRSLTKRTILLCSREGTGEKRGRLATVLERDLSYNKKGERLFRGETASSRKKRTGREKASREKNPSRKAAGSSEIRNTTLGKQKKGQSGSPQKGREGGLKGVKRRQFAPPPRTTITFDEGRGCLIENHSTHLGKKGISERIRGKWGS